jgi:energy-coupling factor transporter ATP-binding protein EcfA2
MSSRGWSLKWEEALVVRWNASVMVDAPWDFDLWKDDALNFVFFADGVAAVRLALASGRPLLLRGPHGSGKTSFAVAVARVLGAELHALQLRSTSSVADLLYRFDQTRSLHDAQMLAHLRDPADYVTFGPIGAAIAGGKSAVVLIENIDLTTESFQSDISELLGLRSFDIAETRRAYQATSPIVYILTSEDRKRIDPGLLARSLVCVMEDPTREMLQRIAHVHHPGAPRELIDQLVAWIEQRRHHALETGSPPPSVGQFLDVVRVALELKIEPKHVEWRAIEAMIPTGDEHSGDALRPAMWVEPPMRSIPVPAAIEPPMRQPPPSAEHGDVFLSYAREDLACAHELVRRLSRDGYRVFWDRDIPAGRRYARVIRDALEAAKCVVVLWSSASVESDWVWDEANFGAKRDILIPVLLEEVDVPLGFGSRQCVDIRAWARDAAVVDPLLRAIAQMVAARPDRTRQS